MRSAAALRLFTALPWLLALASCTPTCPGNCAPVDMAGTAVEANDAFVATFDASRVARDFSCGLQGISITVFDAAAGCATSPVDGLTIFLSDIKPGLYLFFGPANCQAAPAAPDNKGFDAVLRLRGEVIQATGGDVILGSPLPVAFGTFQIQFGGRGALSGRFNTASCSPAADLGLPPS